MTLTAILLEIDYSGAAVLITAVCGGFVLVLGGIGTFRVSMRGTKAAEETNKTLNDPVTGQEAVHKLVNSNMTRMFWVVGILATLVAGLFITSIREANKGPRGAQ